MSRTRRHTHRSDSLRSQVAKRARAVARRRAASREISELARAPLDHEEQIAQLIDARRSCRA